MELIGISGKIGSGKDTVGTIIQCLMTNGYRQNPKLIAQMITDNAPILKDIGTQSGFEIKKFAYKLKQIVALLTRCTVENLEDQEFKHRLLPEDWNYAISGMRDRMPISHFKGDIVFEGNPNRFIKKYTYRDLLQQIGTECMRDGIHQNAWVNALFADYKGKYNQTESGLRRTDEGLIYPNWIITDCRFPNEAEAINGKGGILIRVERAVDGIPSTHPSETSLDNYKFDYVIDNNGSIEELIEKVAKIINQHLSN